MEVTLLGMDMEERLKQFSKASSPILLVPLYKLMVSKLVQPRNKPVLTELTLDRVIDFNLEQFSKAHVSIVVTVVGMLIEVRLLQFWKAHLSMLFTPLGKFMDVRFLQLLKAEDPMVDMLLGMVMEVIEVL